MSRPTVNQYNISMANIINGSKLALRIVAATARQVVAHQLSPHIVSNQSMLHPRLGIIMVGDHPASLSYIRRKKYLSSKANIKSRLFHLQDVDTLPKEQIVAKVATAITKLNQDDKYHGILLQLPLHSKVTDHETELLDMIAPQKDVDCLGKTNRQKFDKQGEKAILKPCVVTGVINMLNSKSVQIKDKRILIIGKGKLVGMPLYSYLQKSTPHLSIVDNTVDIQEIKMIASQSDIIFTATGQPDLLTSSDFKKGCVIVDIGCSPDPEKPGKVRGDIKESVKQEVCQYYTPVPRGVGPMVVASLIQNVFYAWVQQSSVHIKKKK